MLEIGSTFENRGRTWSLAAESAYRRADGTAMTLGVWQTKCRKCEAMVVVTIPRGALAADLPKYKAFGMVHCAAHKMTMAEVREAMVRGRQKQAEARRAVKAAAQQGQAPTDCADLE